MLELLSLPPEILAKITEWLGGAEKKNLRLVCKHTNAIVEPHIFSKLVIKYSNYQPELLCNQLEALATRTTNARTYVRELEIRGFSPDSHLGARSRSRSVERSRSRSRGPLGDAHATNRGLLAHLGLAICSLRKVTSIWWHLSPTDPEWAQVVVMDSLSSLPKIEELKISFGGGSGTALKLEQLSDLRRISIAGYSSDYRTETLPGLRTLVSNSPSLTHLEIDNHSYRAEYDTSTLHEILCDASLNTPLNITHLNPRTMCIRLDAATIPHLRSLESLSLCNVVDTRSDDLSHLDDLGFRDEVQQRTQDFSSSADEIWDMLREERIFLRDIIIDEVSDALLNYLASYSGLRKLRLNWSTPMDAGISDKLASKFYTDVLPTHTETLVSLHVSPSFEGKWCFGRHNLLTFVRCTKLASLTVAIDSQEIEREKKKDTVWTLLKMADDLPHLSHLSILSANPEISQGSNPSMWYISHANKEISESVSTFGPINPAAPWKVVSTPERDYVPRSDKEAGVGLWYRSSMSLGSRLGK